MRNLKSSIKIDTINTKNNIAVIIVDKDWFKVANAPLDSNFFLEIKIGR